MTWFALPGLDWSEPLRILDQWPENLEPGPGVYLLVTSDVDGRMASICRVCGKDASGTLYIGKANSIAGRVNALRRTLRQSEYTDRSHGAGRLLLDTRLRELFPANTLATKWALIDEPGKAENDLLNAYVREFGEGPPLNRQWAISDHD